MRKHKPRDHGLWRGGPLLPKEVGPGAEVTLEDLRFALENAEGCFLGIRSNLLAYRARAKGDAIEASIGLAEFAEKEIATLLTSQLPVVEK